jgi:hypothetical protein
MTRFALALACLALAQDPVAFEHKGKRGQTSSFKQIVQFGIEFKGTEDWVEKIRALSPLFAIQDFIVEADATHEVVGAKDGSVTWKMKYDRANIHGKYDDEAFEYNFSADKKEDPGEDKLKGLVYMIFVGGRHHKLSKLGDMQDLGDPNKDPNGEGLDLLIFPMPRFQNKAVKAGDSWTEEWLSRTTDKDGRHKIKFKQTVTVDKIEGRIAHLKVVLGGAIHKTEEIKSGTEAITPKGEATVQFDIDKGQVVAYDSKGSVDLHLKGTDPNSTDEYDVHIILNGRGKLEPK